MDYSILIVSAVLVGIALRNWRDGIIAMLVVGVLQDALRKLAEAAPPTYVLWSAAIFGVIVVLAWLNKAIKGPMPLYLGSKALRGAWAAFFFLVAFQAVNAYVRWGSLPVVMLGLIFYLAPVVALLVSIAYANTERRIVRFMTAYALIMVPAALTVFLSPGYSDEWNVLKDVGVFEGNQLMIYYGGAALVSHPGLFRVGEIAAWHAATASCFLILLMRKYPSVFFKLLVASLIVLMVGVIILTGRRKMIMGLTIFIFVQWGLLSYYGRGGKRHSIFITLLGIVGSFAFVFLDDAENVSLYADRSKTVFEDVGDRLLLSYELMESAFYRSEWIGLGAGVASQGSRFVGLDIGVGGAAEAGTGKIMVELGLPGVLILVWFVAMLVRRIFVIFRQLARIDAYLLVYAVSFFSILVANFATFTVATQIYSDPFILIILGLVAGFLFAVCRAGNVRYQGLNADRGMSIDLNRAA
jgi:hypothetical protein